MNTLYHADNLACLREHIADESVDLVYLDPPFNSSRSYSLLFKRQKGDRAPAQITAFDDTWSWSPQLYDDFAADFANARLFDLVASLYRILGPSEMLAYILMMAPRLLELERVLKPTGSLYLHCDPVASHYLKIVLDAVFGAKRFRNEIAWKRSDTHNDARSQFARVGDRLLLYAKSDRASFHPQYGVYADQTLRDWYQYLELPDGTTRRMTAEERRTQRVPAGARRFNTSDLRSPNPRPNLMYEYRGYRPHRNGWAVSIEKMRKLDEAGLLVFPSSPDGRIMRKRYLDEQPGPVLGDVWTGPSLLRGTSSERRGYPTQKPLALLERIVAASSDEGDVVLDPFMGGGTTIVAAERLNRRWIGIDLTYLAIAETIHRLTTEYPHGGEPCYRVEGAPATVEEARRLYAETGAQGHLSYRMWAVSLASGQPAIHGHESGIDGRLTVYEAAGRPRLALIRAADDTAGAVVAEIASAIAQEGAALGLLITLEEPTTRMREEAAELGDTCDFGARGIPRLQVRSVAELLEKRHGFELPAVRAPLRQSATRSGAGTDLMLDFDDA